MPSAAKMQIQTAPNGHEKRAIAIGGRALEAVSEAASAAQEKIVAAAGSTEKVVKAHPLTSVGLALGSGILVGAFVARAFAHKTTLTEAFNEKLGLKRRIARAIQGWL